MAHSFTWNGVNSGACGLFVEKITPPARPATRQERTQVPGRDGYLTVGDSSLGEVVRYAECYLSDMSQRDAILAWLRGTGTVVFSTEPDRSCKASILDQLEFIEDAPGNTLIVAFACQPYRYTYPEPPAKTYATSPDSINNPGTADAVPIITVVGSGDIDLTIGGRAIHIDGLASSITIDCDAGMAKEGSGGDLSADLTGTVSLDYYPWTIQPGTAAISWTGSVTSVTITRPWRYI